MASTDASKIGAVLKLACATYRVPFTEDLLAAYVTVLGDADINDVSSAAERHMKTSRFFPAPCDLLSKDRRSDDLLALEAWHAVRKGEFADHLDVAEEALRLLGGHAMLRDLTIQDAPHRRREFVETFKALLAEDEKEELMRGIDDGKGLPS